MEDLLKKVAEGSLSAREAAREIEKRMFGGPESNIDPGRHERTGVPEVILAEGKADGQMVRIIGEFVQRTGRAIVSRLDTPRAENIIEKILEGSDDIVIDHEPLPGFMVVKGLDYRTRSNGGKVGIITAGTSDIPRSMEAELMLREMGCKTMTFNDVGVAGIHRILEPVRKLAEWGADSIIVAAGREGALPTLVSGLTDIPVIGLPISTGYGMHGRGETALFAMLQSCSPLAVVNIDAGFTAGAVAGKIALRGASHRE